MSERKIRWGVLSCANIARDRIVPALLKAENAELEAVAGKQADRREAFRQFNPRKLYDNYEALLNDPDVDAIYIPLPNFLHMEWAIKAMDAGKHVLCEKPMGMNAAQVEAMIEASERNHVLLAEAFSYMHGDVVRKAKEIVASGAIGNIRHIDVRYAFDGVTPTDIRLSKYTGGGVVYDLGCYCVSFIRDIMGEEPSDISSVLGVGQKTLVDEHAMVSMKFPGGRTAAFYAAFDSFTDSVRTIVGDKGVLLIPARYHEFGTIHMCLTDATGRHDIPVECHDHYITEFEEFGQCILDQTTPKVSPEFSLNNARVLDRILGYQ